MKTQHPIILVLANISAFHQAFCQQNNTGLSISDTCKQIQIVDLDDHKGLEASCTAPNGTLYCSILDINDCFALKDGNIMPEDK